MFFIIHSIPDDDLLKLVITKYFPKHSRLILIN